VQNLKNGPDPDDTSGIFKINIEDGSPAKGNPFLSDQDQVLHKYFAYGVRNGFGLSFDPVTGML
jgi:glucose/arabinose dehydrogenase